MVTILYQKFDEYLASQPKPVVVQASFPKNDSPVIVDDEYQEFLKWKEFKNKMQQNTVIQIRGETVNPDSKKPSIAERAEKRAAAALKRHNK
jgi:hypothetical protein